MQGKSERETLVRAHESAQQDSQATIAALRQQLEAMSQRDESLPLRPSEAGSVADGSTAESAPPDGADAGVSPCMISKPLHACHSCHR